MCLVQVHLLTYFTYLRGLLTDRRTDRQAERQADCELVVDVLLYTRLGIIGEPLSLFDPVTLVSLEADEETEE